MRKSLGQSVISYGGYQAVYRWNTDAFELTKPSRKKGEKALYGVITRRHSLIGFATTDETQQVLFGVAKFEDNSFENFTSKGIDDYDWYETFDEAVKHGPVGAYQMDVTAPVGAKWQGRGTFPLKVKHDNIGIGAETKTDRRTSW